MTSRRPRANEPQVQLCDTVDDFIGRVRTTRWALRRVFRGQRDVSWPLWSLWDRKLHPLRGGDPNRDLDKLFGPEGRENRNRFRDMYLQRFRSLIKGLPGVDTTRLLDDNHAWAVGRHHGLVTPLLDWTYSPFVALFFACYDHIRYHNEHFDIGGPGLFPAANVSHTDPVAVWELAYDDAMIVTGEFEIFESRLDNAYRQKAQGGLFSILTHQTHSDLEAYLTDRKLAFRLTRYQLSGAEVGRALWTLRLMNITYANLFPDLHGAAAEANTASAMNSLKHHFGLPDEE